MDILTNVNLNKNEIRNAVMQPLAVAPTNAIMGQMYFNSADLCLYQHDGSAWKKVGVVYNKTSSAGNVITGLGTDGTVTGTNVISLTLTGLTPVEDGYVTNGMTLENAFKVLDEAVKNAVAGGGEVNQNAWSNISVGGVTVAANAKTDTFSVTGSGAVSVTGNASNKTVTVGVTVDSTLSTTSTNPVQNKVINTAISGKYTKPTDGIPESDLASALQSKIDTAVQKDGSVTMTGALAMGNHKITGLADGTANTDAVSLGQMNTALGGKADTDDLDDYLPLGGGTMAGALNMNGNAINNIPNASAAAQPVAYGQLPTTPVVTDFDLSYNGDTVTINKEYLNVKTGATSSDDEAIALANSTTAGLMSPSDVNAISDLQDRVDALEGTTVRLLYTEKTNPTATEIQTFVQGEGYTDSTKWSGIAVVVAGTYHIWHYYTGGTGWKDDGVDTVSQFTNSSLGTIKGAATDGKVYAESDGTGSVYGWDTLKTRVTNVENNKADQADVDAIPVIKTATGAIATTSKTVSVSYSGTMIGYFVKDGSGNIVITDVAVGATSVTFSTAQNPSTALTATVVYI